MRQSFQKVRRLRKRSEFLFVQRTGVSSHGRYFICVRKDGGAGRVGITVTKKVGNAVTRNRVRRIVREFVRRKPFCSSGPDVVLIAKARAATASAQQAWADLQRLYEINTASYERLS